MHSEPYEDIGPQIKFRNKSFKPNKEMNKSQELDETPQPLGVSSEFDLSLQLEHQKVERLDALAKWNTNEGNHSVVEETSNETSLARSLTPLSSHLPMQGISSN